MRNKIDTKGKHLLIGGIKAKEIAKRFGTPLYVYNIKTILDRLNLLKKVFPKDTKIFYSVKANPLLFILNVIAKKNFGAEVASYGELKTALKAGFKPNSIVFAGPGKTIKELDFAVKKGIYSIHVESINEINRLGIYKKYINIGLRVNPKANIIGAKMRMGGGSQPFGIDEEKIDQAIKTIKLYKNLKLIGFHCYPGTQLFSANGLLEFYKYFFEFCLELKGKFNLDIEYIDLGGGFASPLYHGDKEIDLEELSFGIKELWKKYKEKAAKKLFIEPGRFVVSSSGFFLTKIIDKKESRGRTYLIVDGGMQANALASGTAGQIFKKWLPVIPADNMDKEFNKTFDIVGPLCTPLDVVGRDIVLPDLEPGAILAFLNSGAYSFSISHLAFLSKDIPSEVCIYKKKIYLARKRLDGNFWLRWQDLSNIE